MKKFLMLAGILTMATGSAAAQEYYRPYQPQLAPAEEYPAYPAPVYNQPASAYAQPGYPQPAPMAEYPAPVIQNETVAVELPAAQPAQPAAYRTARIEKPRRPEVKKTRNRRGDELKPFSIGMDYVSASTTMVDQDFTIENPLYGASPYKGKTSDFEDNLDSLNGNFGWRPFKYFGLEAFYQHSLSDNQVKYEEHYADYHRFAQAEYDVSYYAYGLDAIGYLPVGNWMELLASVGVANYEFSADVKLNAYRNSTAELVTSNPLKMDESKLAYRIGAGFQIWLSQRLAFRAMYRYISIGGDYFDDISEISLGVRYNF